MELEKFVLGNICLMEVGELFLKVDVEEVWKKFYFWGKLGFYYMRYGLGTAHSLLN